MLAGARRCCRRAPIAYQPACKPGSVRRRREPSCDGHSSATPVARCLMRPTRTAGSGHRSRLRRRLRTDAVVPFLFGLAPGGVYRATGVAAGAVRSYRTVSPLPAPAISRCKGRGAAGPGGLLSVALSLGSRPPDVIRHRMSMEPGLSSRARLSASARAAVRPTDVTGNGEPDAQRQGPHALRMPDGRQVQRGAADQCGWIGAAWASRAAISALSVDTVEMSTTPSTRSGRKCRWNAATASRVVPSR
jgi:hypothetical protein